MGRRDINFRNIFERQEDNIMNQSYLLPYDVINVYVIFSGTTNLWWLKFLKNKFRHCYLILELSNHLWLEINPLSNQTFINIYEYYPANLCFSDKVIVVKTNLQIAPLCPAPLGFFTCVECVKRMLGIHNFFIFTPYRLYKFLTKIGKKS